MSLELYLIRHGIAEDRAEDGRDASRRLTDEGMERLREIGAGLKVIGVRWHLVLTSPLVRARQTAEVLLKEIGGEAPPLQITSTLIPSADVEAVLSELPDADRGEARVALVSHEPLLGELAARLLGARTPLPFKKGAVCRIDFDEPPDRGPGTLRWFAPPKVLRRVDG